jgi:hypothetical protein
MRKVFIFILLFSSFGKAKAQVKYQTGSAEFGLPIFQWEDDKSRLNSAVSLSYTSGNGLKVADVASNVGQGWHLQIGGSITRIQSGEPDDQKPRDGNFDDITKYPPGYLYDPISAAEGCPNKLAQYPIFTAKNKIYKNYNQVSADKELDRFSFEINGRSGVFCLGKNNGDKGILLGDGKMKIWFTRNENMSNIRTTINAFFIQDENGVIYTFNKLSLSKALKVRHTDASGTYPQELPKFEDGNVYHESSFDDGSLANPYIVNGWVLTEMEDAITHRKILFNYVERNINASAGENFAAYAENNYSIITHTKSIGKAQEITSMVYPDGHVVTVNYGDARVDFNGQYAVKSVDVQYGGRFISKYELNTQYFIGNRIGTPVTTYQKSLARLCLTSIKKIGIDLMSDETPYKFEYNLGSSGPDDIVPPPFSYRKDIWGFYNGSNSKGFGEQDITLTKPMNDLISEEIFGLCFIRRNGSTNPVINPKIGYAKNGLLKKILYPTGGSLQYEYEQNTGLLNGQQANIGGVHVSKSITSDDGNNYNCDVTNLTTNYKYSSATNANESSIWGVENPVNKFSSSSFYNPLVKKYKWGVRGCGIFGCCKYKYRHPGILSRDQAIDLDGHQQFLEALSTVLDVISTVMTVVNIINIALGATGYGTIIAAGIDLWVGLYVLIKTCTKNYSKWIHTNIYYNSELNNNPLPIQYSRVEVAANNGENGRTVMEFTSPQDYPIWEPTNPALSNKQRFAYWAYGLPKKTTVYDVLGKVVKQSENEYDYQYAKTTNAEIIGSNGVPQTVPIIAPSCKCLVKQTYSNRSDWWMDMNPAIPENNPAYYTKNMTSNGSLLADIYNMYTGRVELRKTTERVASTTSTALIENSTTYEYGKTYLPIAVTTVQSNGDINKTTTKYTGDAWLFGSNQGTALSTLVQNNVLNLPVVTRNMVTKATDNITYDLNETVTDYQWLTDAGSSDIKPVAIFAKRFVQPTPVVSALGFGGPGVLDYTPNSTSPYKAIKYFQYDNGSNLSSVWGEMYNNRQAYMYDYNDKYITATIINAGASHTYNAAGGILKYEKNATSYTSFETTKENGWKIMGTPNYLENTGVTGKKAFELNQNNSIKSYDIAPGTGLNNTYGIYDALKLSFWATNAVGITLTNASIITVVPTATGPTINGFTYYEYKIDRTVNTAAVVDITLTNASEVGNAIIDEIRLYRADARMQTSTYDPLLGKTSECDENNRITYYEYDEKGRIRFVKDEKKNVVKMYEYNNATKQIVNCPGVPSVSYTNLTTSEVFLKECRGYPYDMGSSVTYTVPAGTYTSTVSQAVVDLLVEQDLQTNGQAYANANGTCIPLFGNAVQSALFTKEDCEVGYTGTTITYTVPANRYYATSMAAANTLAQAELNANGQAFANAPGNATCVIDLLPDWEGVEPAVTQCGTGANAGHIMVQVIDINPNSPSYNTTTWSDGGSSAACGGTEPTYIDITYTNAGNTQATIKLKNLTSMVVYTMNAAPNTTTQADAGFVPAGNYEVTVTLPFGSNANTISVYNTTQMNSFYQANVTVGTSALPIVRITL